MPQPRAAGDGALPDITTVIAAATALVTGVGALTVTGSLGRIQRNHPVAFSCALGLAILGAGIALVAPLISEHARPIKIGKRTLGARASAQGLGAALMVIAVLVGFITAVVTSTNTERPAVSVELDDKTFELKATGTVSNLGSADRMAMVAHGLVDRGGQYEIERTLSSAFGGPDGDGDAKASLDVQVPPGRYDAIGVKAFTEEHPQGCDEFTKGGDGGTGCVVVPLPARPDQPQVTASWQGEGRTADSVAVTVKVGNAAGGGEDSAVIGVNVVGLRGEQLRPIYRSIIAPPVGGAASRTLRLPVDPHYTMICAQASAVTPGDTLPAAECPLGRVDPGVATAELHVPDP